MHGRREFGGGRNRVCGLGGAASVLPGDVIAGVMGLFGDVEDVSGLGID